MQDTLPSITYSGQLEVFMYSLTFTFDPTNFEISIKLVQKETGQTFISQPIQNESLFQGYSVFSVLIAPYNNLQCDNADILKQSFPHIPECIENSVIEKKPNPFLAQNHNPNTHNLSNTSFKSQKEKVYFEIISNSTVFSHSIPLFLDPATKISDHDFQLLKQLKIKICKQEYDLRQSSVYKLAIV